MFQVVLFQPEIPPNTGNIIRLCANTGCALHLVEPLGFRMDDRALRRAGLDYHEFAPVRVHADWEGCCALFRSQRMFAFSTRATTRFDRMAYVPGDVLLFGPETRGLPEQVLQQFDPRQRVRLPMLPGNRSLNLSNAVAVAVFEAWRQNGFGGAGA
jgi:tRNA (cytidine/uridine-2'-O-)-methyltransferase